MANHTQDGHIGQHITGSHKKAYNQKPDIGFSTAPPASPNQTVAQETLATLVDMWDLQGSSDLSSEINGYTLVVSGDGSQNVTGVVGPNGVADNAITIGGSATNALAMSADIDAFDITDEDGWWSAAIYIVSAAGTYTMWGKGTGWVLLRSGGVVYSQSPNTVTATGPTVATGQWKVLIGWRDSSTDKAYLDVDGTVYESPGTGIPSGNANAIRFAGGDTMRYARMIFGKGAVPSEEMRDYLRNNNEGRTYAEIVSDAA